MNKKYDKNLSYFIILNLCSRYFLATTTTFETKIICFALFQCDPYIKISLGRKSLDDRDKYKPNTLNPEFGR